MTKHKLESLAIKVTNKQLSVWTEINTLLTYVKDEANTGAIVAT